VSILMLGSLFTLRSIPMPAVSVIPPPAARFSAQPGKGSSYVPITMLGLMIDAL
jgi:hypothetical protein